MSSNVRNRLKSGKKSRKDPLCAKMQKNGYGEFDHSGTLIATTHRQTVNLFLNNPALLC